MCAIAGVAFVDARFSDSENQRLRELLVGTLAIVSVVGFAAALVWALSPVFSRPDGLRVPPLALSVLGILVVATPVVLFVYANFYFAFGGVK
jgi:cobalamin biosynthesis protein CobD/CbiB